MTDDELKAWQNRSLNSPGDAATLRVLLCEIALRLGCLVEAIEDGVRGIAADPDHAGDCRCAACIARENSP